MKIKNLTKTWTIRTCLLPVKVRNLPNFQLQDLFHQLNQDQVTRRRNMEEEIDYRVLTIKITKKWRYYIRRINVRKLQHSDETWWYNLKIKWCQTKLWELKPLTISFIKPNSSFRLMVETIQTTFRECQLQTVTWTWEEEVLQCQLNLQMPQCNPHTSITKTLSTCSNNRLLSTMKNITSIILNYTIIKDMVVDKATCSNRCKCSHSSTNLISKNTTQQVSHKTESTLT